MNLPYQILNSFVKYIRNLSAHSEYIYKYVYIEMYNG